MWVWLDGAEMRQVTVTVPRVFYINMRNQSTMLEEDEKSKRVSKILPRGRPNLHLYQV